MNDHQSPPQNIEAEGSILGGILLDPNAISRIADILPPEAFFISAYQLIYQAALELYRRNQPTDLMTLSTWLSDHKWLEKVGGQTTLVRLVEGTVSATNIDRYAQLVLDKYKRRQLIEASNDIATLGYDTSSELETVLHQAEDRIYQIAQDKTDRFQPASVSDCLVTVWNQLEEGSDPPLSTGITSLDKLVGGFFKTDLIVVGARASMGKTWFGCHFANHVAATYNLPVVIFSAEMSKEQITKRLLAMHSGIDSARLRRELIYEDELDTLAQAFGTLSNLPIIIDDTPPSYQHPARMRSVLRRVQYERGAIGLIVMDYLQLMGSEIKGNNRAQEIGRITRDLKSIAREFSCSFIALAQIHRGVEAQSNKRPRMSDLRDSGEIEQAADLVLLLYREDYYDRQTVDKRVVEIIADKNRNGSTGICKTQFDLTNGRIA
jgi:replicative DNA helicase